MKVWAPPVGRVSVGLRVWRHAVEQKTKSRPERSLLYNNVANFPSKKYIIMSLIRPPEN
jgi:hypothetical protein